MVGLFGLVALYFVLCATACAAVFFAADFRGVLLLHTLNFLLNLLWTFFQGFTALTDRHTRSSPAAIHRTVAAFLLILVFFAGSSLYIVFYQKQGKPTAQPSKTPKPTPRKTPSKKIFDAEK